MVKSRRIQPGNGLDRLAVVAVLCLLAWWAASAKAEVGLTGVRQVPPSTVRRWLAEIGPRPADEIARLVQERYRQQGFFDACVMAAQASEGGDPTLHISEGAPVKFGDVTVRVPEGFDGERVRVLARSVFSGVASMENLENGMSEIVRELVDAGYFAAQVLPGRFRREKNLLSFDLDIAPGSPARVGAWKICGLQRTDTARVRQLLGLTVGVPWDRREWMRVEERIRQCDYLSLAGDLRVCPPDGNSLVVVEVPLAERPAVVTDGGLGFAGGGENGREVRGRLNLTVENPFGDGRGLELLVSRPSDGISESRLGLSDPHVAGSPVGVHIDLGQFRQSDAYDRVSIAAEGSTYATHNCRVHLLLSWSKITPLAGEAYARPARRYDLALSAGQNAGRGSYASAGSHTTWGLGATASFRREFPVAADETKSTQSRVRVLVSAGHVRSLNRWIGFRLSAKLESWLGPDAMLGWGDELYLGGPETVRGVPERSLCSRGFGVLNAEAGCRLAAQLEVFVSGDLALYRGFRHDQSVGRSLRHALGYGLGLELSSRAGRTRVELAWPERGALGDGVMYLRWLRGW